MASPAAATDKDIAWHDVLAARKRRAIGPNGVARALQQSVVSLPIGARVARGRANPDAFALSGLLSDVKDEPAHNCAVHDDRMADAQAPVAALVVDDTRGPLQGARKELTVAQTAPIRLVTDSWIGAPRR